MDVHPPNPALDVFLILLSELHRSGTLDDEGLARKELGRWAEFPGCAKRCEQQMRAVLDGGGPLSHATLRSKLGLGAWEGPSHTPAAS